MVVAAREIGGRGEGEELFPRGLRFPVDLRSGRVRARARMHAGAFVRVRVRVRVRVCERDRDR